jgi:hypothetical protein
MRPWDMEDCEVSIFQLKDKVVELECRLEEMSHLIFELQDELSSRGERV